MKFYYDWIKQQTSIPKTEVGLFRLFARLLSQHYVGVHYYEVHGNKCQVEFTPKVMPVKAPKARKEIGDLIIVVYSNKDQRARYTVMQNKLEKSTRTRRTFPNFKFRADSLQWDLLTFRPAVRTVVGKTVPKNILKGTKFSSVGSYGVFYRAKGGKFDFVYSTANWLVPQSFGASCNLILNTIFGSELTHLGNGEIEKIWTVGIKNFVESLIDFEIGAPVADARISSFLGELIQTAAREVSQDPPKIDIPEFLPTDDFEGGEGNFRLLVINTDEVRRPTMILPIGDR